MQPATCPTEKEKVAAAKRAARFVLNVRREMVRSKKLEGYSNAAIENPGVVGSSPSLSTIYGQIAQLVEH